MVSVYEPIRADGFEFCHPDDQEDFETINVEINGIPRRETWRPLQMHLVREDEGRTLALSDSPWLGSHALILRDSAVSALRGKLLDYGELLPLRCAEADLVVFNATRVVDALDESASGVKRFASGRIMRITRYQFRPEALGSVEIFKIPNLRASPTFLRGEIVEIWRSAGLQGLNFEQVWSAS